MQEDDPNKEKSLPAEKKEQAEPEETPTEEPQRTDIETPSMQRVFEGFVAKVSQTSMPAQVALIEKFEPQHIDKLLDGFQKSDERDFKNTGSIRKYGLTYTILAIALIVFFSIFFKSDIETLRLIITFLVGLGGGLLAGYGWGSRKR